MLFKNLENNQERELMITKLGALYTSTRIMGVKHKSILLGLLRDKKTCKIDVGPIYTNHGEVETQQSRMCIFKKNDRKHQLTYWGKELCLDIDHEPMIEWGCTHPPKTLCEKCWAVLYVRAMRMHENLVHFFGARERQLHCKTFFSGRRGIHMWVMDDDIVRMTRDERINLMYYMKHAPMSDEMFTLATNIWCEHLKGPAEQCTKEQLNDFFAVNADDNVTTDPHHLLKMPFISHKDTHIATAIHIPCKFNVFVMYYKKQYIGPPGDHKEI